MKALQDGLVKAAAAYMSRRAGRCRLSILMFHRVLPAMDPYLMGIPDAPYFSAILSCLSRTFNVVPLSEGLEMMARNDLPPRSVAITFDDGYADNAEVALPLLMSHGMRATFFVATSFLDGGIMWNDMILDIMRNAPSGLLDLSWLGLEDFCLDTLQSRRHCAEAVIAKLKYALPCDREGGIMRLREQTGVPAPTSPMMTRKQVCELFDAGMEIGAHTLTHPILARLDVAQARVEIQESKQQLEQMLRAPVTCFAYPNGKPGQDYTWRDVGLVGEAGFAWAVSTAWGAASSESDPLQLPRFTPWDRDPLRFAIRLTANYRRDRAAVVTGP